ncbi:MAG: SAM-dependent methyltransferase [Ruminococcaceae bacterium]|nr:SAM-dependent methyltransferase [Oscillospiraceae bacterium]
MMTSSTMSAQARMCALILSAADQTVLRKAVFSKPKDPTLQKAVLTLRESAQKRFLQIELFHKDNKVTHQNLNTDADAASALSAFSDGFDQINLICSLGECEYKRSKSNKEILLGGDKLERKLQDPNLSPKVSAPLSNNREKQYILSGNEPFLRCLGVSDANGRVYDRKQAKFRQINRFLELIRDVEDKLPRGEIRICDLCCGKSYLSFAVYHYFANIKGYKVSMTGIDLKSDVIEHCSRTARDLGFDGLEFVTGDIRAYTTDVPPSLVISLHACDIATDIVLQKATDWQADVILSTPCCHHEMNKAISSPALSFITDYSMLRQKLCDAATDALRLKRLEAHGYATAALELIDPEETPKNIMLRAVRKRNFKPDSPEARRAMNEYLNAKRFLCGDELEDLHF